MILIELPIQEVTLGEDYTSLCDVYSFAIVSWEIMFATLPYKNEKAKAQIHIRVAQSEEVRPSLTFNSSEEDIQTDVERNIVKKYISIMKICWRRNPEERFDCTSLAKLYEELIEQLKSGTTSEISILTEREK